VLSPARCQAEGTIDAGKYPNLQAAFDAVPESGGIVNIPPGEYRITQPLLLTRSNTRVVGAGAASKILNMNSQGKPALVVRPASRDSDKNARIWRIQLSDFRICGDPNAVDAQSGKSASGDGVVAEGINELYVHGLSVDHTGGNGLHMIDCYEDPRIADSIFTYNAKAGVRIQAGHDIVVSANHFEENQDALQCVDSFNLCMTGNNIDDHLGNGIIVENTYGSVLSGNMIEECNGTAIILDRDCYGITISANVIAHDFGGGVDLRHAWGCAVSANTFVLDPKYSVRVGKDSGRITITGNSIANSHIGGKAGMRRKVEDDIAHGILLEQTSDINITGNQFSGLQTTAVQATGKCQRVIFATNILVDLNRATKGDGKPFDLDGVDNVMVDKNLISK
jgi:hypothetical protein